MLTMPLMVMSLLLLTRVESRGDQPTPSCADRGRCNASLPDSDRNCRCDDRCGLYSDCCWDVQPQTPSLPLDTFSCHSNPRYMASPRDVIDDIYIINRCPSDFHDNETRALCEDNGGGDLLLDVPVNGRRTGVLYKNIFCAVCGGIDSVEDASDVVFWTVRKECLGLRDHSTEIEELFNDTASEPCTVRHTYFSPSDTALDGRPAVRKCVRQTSHCPDDWDLDPGSNVTTEMCGGTMDRVYTSWKAFRNKFCALCHGISDVSCVRPKMSMPGPFIRVPSYSVLLDPNMGYVSKYEREQPTGSTKPLPVVDCPSGKVYDVFSQRCRRLHKPGGPIDLRIKPFGDHQSTPHPDCIMVLYNSTEFTVLANGSVSVKSTDKVYNIGEFGLVNNSLSACMDQTIPHGPNMTEVVRTDPHEIIKRYLTLVGLVLSLVSLAACIVAHSIFSELQNVPGKCVLGLSCSLFVAQLFFLTTITLSESPGCYFFALLIQYSFLAAFCWTNCLAFDMCRAFSRTHTSAGGHIKRYIRYSCYAWLTPLVPMVMGIILDVVDGVSDEFRPHYGDPICWINRGKALLLIFVVPMAMSIAANFVMFVVTSRSIYLSKKVSRQATRREESTRVLDLVLYIKLSVIMGLTWIFGLLAVSSNLDAFWYLFIIFNSLQGLLLFLSFVCTKRVKKLARDKRSSLATSTLLQSFKRLSNSATSTGVYATQSMSASSEVNTDRH